MPVYLFLTKKEMCTLMECREDKLLERKKLTTGKGHQLGPPPLLTHFRQRNTLIALLWIISLSLLVRNTLIGTVVSIPFFFNPHKFNKNLGKRTNH